MPSALPGDICIGQHSVCIVRIAKLQSNCEPQGGADSGIVTAGIITATASPVLQEGISFEPPNGCGDISWTYETPDKIRSFTVSGELSFFDHEMMVTLFGGSLVVGAPGTDFAGDNIGWAAPNYTDAPPAPVYLEFITKTAGAGVGECAPPGAPFPFAVGHIFGKGRYVPGDRTFAAEAASVAFTGTSVANPNLENGPWNDYNGVGGIPNSPYVQISYSEAEYDLIADTAACGFSTLPVQT